MLSSSLSFLLPSFLWTDKKFQSLQSLPGNKRDCLFWSGLSLLDGEKRIDLCESVRQPNTARPTESYRNRSKKNRKASQTSLIQKENPILSWIRPLCGQGYPCLQIYDALLAQYMCHTHSSTKLDMNVWREKSNSNNTKEVTEAAPLWAFIFFYDFAVHILREREREKEKICAFSL